MNRVEGEISIFDQDIWYGKTFLVPSQAELRKDRTSPPSLKKSSKSQSRTPVCVCVPDKGWTKSGCYYSEDGRWSIAWRLHDAQFWGVPQRRKRIALVADFAGLSAPEILFERKGVCRSAEQGEEERKATSRTAGESIDCSSETGGGKGILIQNDRAGTISTCTDQSVLTDGRTDGRTDGSGSLRPVQPSNDRGCSRDSERKFLRHGDAFWTERSRREEIMCLDMANERRHGASVACETAFSIIARAGTGGNNVPCVVEKKNE